MHEHTQARLYKSIPTVKASSIDLLYVSHSDYQWATFTPSESVTYLWERQVTVMSQHIQVKQTPVTFCAKLSLRLHSCSRDFSVHVCICTFGLSPPPHQPPHGVRGLILTGRRQD